MMVSETDKSQESFSDGLDIKIISDLIHAMNMAASKLLSYPDGHPFVVESFRRAEDILRGVFESRGHLTFGIAKNAVMVGTKVLGQKNPIFQRFAQTLFEHGVVGLTLQRGLTAKELKDFDSIISQKRNDVAQQGGVNTLLSKANIRHIQVKLIDYGIFQARDELDSGKKGKEELQSASFWESFVRGLFEGTLDPASKSDIPLAEMSPEALARMLNNTYMSQESKALEGLDFALLTNMQKWDIAQFAENDESKRRLFKFTESLNDELRQCFLEGFFNSLPDDGDMADRILSGFPEEIILEALQKCVNRQLYVPPNIMKVLQRIAKSSGKGNLEGVDDLLETYSKEELLEKLSVIFKEDEVDRFVPPDYQKVLQDVIVAEDLSAPELSEVHQLSQTLSEHSIKTSFTSILVDIIVAQSGRNVSDSLKKSLKDRCVTLMQNGDFHIVFNIIETINANTVLSGNDQTPPPGSLMEIFSDEAFVKEVLTSAARWGKEKYFYITRLMKGIGPSFFSEQLLNRLADEENRTARLFYLDLLKEPRFDR